YALGVVLYEALTGRMPLDSECLASLLTAKHHQRPSPPSALCAGVPDDLDALVVGLLEREPAARKGLADVLAWCGDATEPRTSPAPRAPSPDPGPLPGSLTSRRDPLQRLARALGGLRRREP